MRFKNKLVEKSKNNILYFINTHKRFYNNLSIFVEHEMANTNYK